jgi:SAM-dependent methyltransferase
MVEDALMTDHTTYFSGRVENYVRYRPSYPPEIIDLLARECGLAKDWTIADIGSGPGNLARLFLQYGTRVYGVEPNQEMRAAGEQLLGAFPGFTSVAATAEATGLPEASVDLVTAGQAFHWFDSQRAGSEFRRILRPPQWVALVWNERRSGSSPFLTALDQFLGRYVRSESQRREAGSSSALQEFFSANGYREATFANRQTFDFAGFCGRILSTSYAPLPGEAGHAELLDQLRTLFETHEAGGTVAFEYETQVYYGRL